ncbi:MAG: hypothetical protein ACREIA_19525 [Opitutaceae bacterium]
MNFSEFIVPSFLPYIAGETRSLRRRDGWKIVINPCGTTELHHLPSDPGERHNLAAIKERAETRSEMEKQLAGIDLG